MATDRHAELRTVLSEARSELLRTLNSLVADDWGRPSPNEGWTAKDTLAHLCTIEERMRTQVQCALEGGAWAPAEDIDTYNARKVQERRGWTVVQLREELEREEATTLATLESLGEGDLDRAFTHPRWGRTTAEKVFLHIADHLRTHTREIAVRSPG